VLLPSLTLASALAKGRQHACFSNSNEALGYVKKGNAVFESMLYYVKLVGIAFDEAIEEMIINKIKINEKYFNRYISFWNFTF